MERDYLDFEVSIETTAAGQVARVTSSPAGTGDAAFALPFGAADLAQFMIAVGPPRVSSRRLVPAEARVVTSRTTAPASARRCSRATSAPFRESLATATGQGSGLRLRLRLDGAPDLDPVPWEYLYDTRLDRFLTLSSQTPIVRPSTPWTFRQPFGSPRRCASSS